VDKDQENNLRNAITGGCVSRRWVLKSTAKFAAGAVAVSTLGVPLASEAETPRPKEIREAIADIWDRF
jgi:hypothetical protein